MNNKLTTAEIYQLLKNTMPGIGFLSQNKRVAACFAVCYYAEELITNNKAVEDDVCAALTLLYNQYKPFMKACLAVALIANRYNVGSKPGRVCQEFVNGICYTNNLPGFGAF